MGTRAKNVDHEPGEVSVVEAVKAALATVVPHRGISRAAEAAGITNTTMRRLVQGTGKKVSADQIEALRRIPGFSAAFDSLVSNPDADGMDHIARRLARAFDEGGAEQIVFQLEELGHHLDAEEIANLLREQAKLFRKAKPKPTASEENRQNRRKTAK